MCIRDRYQRRVRGPTPPDMSAMLSVIVPTYNETENIRPLCTRLFAAAKEHKIDVELLVMDDESPGSGETKRIVEALAKDKFNIRIHCRTKKEGRGLSSAVLLGFEMATHETVLCMDADLQHRPEQVPDVAEPVLAGQAEYAIGSRHVGGGGLGFEWSLLRRAISKTATLLAWPLTSSTDPMSGFFCTTKTVLKRGQGKLNPIGFKIALEVASRCRCDPIVDVGIIFDERVAGESKLSMKQNFLYIQQLMALYWDRYAALIVIAVIAIVAILYQVTMTVLL
eukprot:TRINITY_DN16601_c0_g1_i5.p2 TRINITY_DN16601_c0_g1~~TRINITY_DN16601_c0_g1_i5.p2  ORF type:complete len:281 (-),score=82.41 TRINITY_DN16601_c0_g1_i5:36-878(-)